MKGRSLGRNARGSGFVLGWEWQGYFTISLRTALCVGLGMAGLLHYQLADGLLALAGDADVVGAGSERGDVDFEFRILNFEI